jgi:TetR/AcrR family transcriptional repressor of nem operon
MNINNTKEKILIEAESLIQRKGFNAFSFKDIANAIGIKTASIHYHFPSKEALGIEVITWHTEKIFPLLSSIALDHRRSANDKIHALFDVVLTSTYKNDKKMCLGGMMASDFQSLPTSIQNKISTFFKLLINWMKEVLVVSGYTEQESLLLSKQIMSQLEGALLLVRLYQDESFLDGVSDFIDKVIV